MKEIQKRTILITGASNGIGYETALNLSNDPSNKVIALARNFDKLMALQTISKGAISILQYDLEKNNPQLITNYLTKHNFEKIDILIHNAGKIVNKPFGDISEAELKACYDVNVFAPYLLTQALLPYLENASRSHVINVSSVGGIQGSVKFAGLSAYSSSKGALLILTECLALELQPKNIFVNCLALGAVQTEMLNNAFPGYKAPLEPNEMAEFISWFALNGSKFFNGKILPVALSTP
jgi:short-subunit dehydrogenase